MEFNILVHLLAALVPMIVGFIWYHKSVFGTAWMNAAGMTDEKVKGGNMPVIFGLSFVMAFLLSLAYKALADHGVQFAAFFRSVEEHGMGIDAASAFGSELKGYIDAYVTKYHTWRSGIPHSLAISIPVILPIIVTNALFERKSFKYMMVNWGYWAVTLCLMFMVVAQWG